jgi:hypothetical protein
VICLFRSGVRPACLKAADVNGDRHVDFSDPVSLLLFLFRGGPTPPQPFVHLQEPPRTPEELCGMMEKGRTCSPCDIERPCLLSCDAGIVCRRE